MKGLKIALIIIFVALVAFGGWYFYKKKTDKDFELKLFDRKVTADAKENRNMKFVIEL